MPILAYSGNLWYGSASGAVIDTAPTIDVSASIKANLTGAVEVQGGNIAPALKGTMARKQTVIVQAGGSLEQASWKKRARAALDVSIGASPSAFDIAQAVLNAVASSYNIAGTIGAKINASGSGGVDPQAIRDAFTLASEETPATGSIDDKLNKIKTDTGVIPAAV